MDSKQRFSNRADVYAKYRPTYPREAVTAICGRVGLAEGAAVADVGSGTGLWTEKLLEAGLDVYAVEPNLEMRSKAEVQFVDQPRFHSCDGSAEATGLASNSVRLVTAGQAFHWFEPTAALPEFCRVIEGDPWMAIVWNTRDREASEFMDQYSAFLTEFRALPVCDHYLIRSAGKLGQYFTAESFELLYFHHEFQVDFAALTGMVGSMSNMPEAGSKELDEMMIKIRPIFEKNAVDGSVRYCLKTELYIGKINSKF